MARNRCMAPILGMAREICNAEFAADRQGHLMPKPLPPLSAVRAFEAAARLGSFTRAAGELHMTQAAVSYQIKQLEQRLGLRLFQRQPRQVVLTPAGQR